MHYEPILEFRDKSYYVDELVKLTSRPRPYWANLSLSMLRRLLLEQARRLRKEHSRGYQKFS